MHANFTLSIMVKLLGTVMRPSRWQLRYCAGSNGHSVSEGAKFITATWMLSTHATTCLSPIAI